MSFKGVIEARCPRGCESFETEIWSFIHGRRSPELRETAQAGELNLLLCPGCGAAFFAEAAYVYFEPEDGIIAFVFPESHRAEEPRWRGKMRDDFAALKKVMGEKMPIDIEPEVFFGPDGLAELLEARDRLAEEVEVMAAVAGGLGLALYRVPPVFSRRQGVPALLPHIAGAQALTREGLIAGLERLLAANDRLTTYRGFLDSLRASPKAGLPPGRF